MKTQTKWFACLSVCLSLLWTAAISAVAEPTLPKIFADHMVLQRDQPIPVFGQAEPGEVVTVTFGDQEKSTTTDAAGDWMLKLDALPASAQAQKMTVRSDRSDKATVFQDVLIGEVWVCSGQSNMAWPIVRSAKPKQVVEDADFPEIRFIRVKKQAADLPADDFALDATWQACSPETAGDLSAVGYHFGRQLHEELSVPVGLISSNWGGTRIEPWTPPVGFRGVEELAELSAKVDATLPWTKEGAEAYRRAIEEVDAWTDSAKQAIDGKTELPPLPTLPSTGNSHQSPTRLYNAMIHPMVPFGIRGAIWYQGESNSSDGESYFHKMDALISGWREVWGQKALPFYFVQLANFREPTEDPAGGDGWAKIREGQRKSLTLPDTGMAVTIDIGEANDIHPKNKQDVGKRLALWALAKTYSRDIVFSGPLYQSHAVEDDKLRIQFDHAGSGLAVGEKSGLEPTKIIEDGDLKQFAIAGEDRVWHWATATIDGDCVVLHSDQVEQPVAARYAFRMNPQGANLYNREGLPASPFRTDDWPLEE
jgi:sialate O-acetylesterase